MKLLAGDRTDFHRGIDPEYGPEQSVVLRYRNAFQYAETGAGDSEFKTWLQKTSIKEGMRIFPLLTYKGVRIFILDETTLMQTRTLKSIDGCITIAKCKQNGYEKVVFETGGNTGTALTQYGIRAGLETFMLIPEDNLHLLDSKAFESEKAHLFSIARPGLVKEAAHLLASLGGMKRIPETEWRFESSMFRGLFILEHILEKESFDWLSQTISAAFGPIGIYRAFKAHGKVMASPPRFLGIQQEANCPMYKAWKDGTYPTEAKELNSLEGLLTRVMYDVKPQTYGTYEGLRNILTTAGGALTTINRGEFDDFLGCRFDGKNILELLGEQGIEIKLSGGEVVEKTGLIALAGTLKEIDKGRMAAGSKVLCSLTSGASEADGRAKPELRISSLDDLKGFQFGAGGAGPELSSIEG